jgi:glyceraldehyde 3-phosphate dehydrogenase
MVRIAINGYGRIGRGVHRLSLLNDNVDVVAINSRSGADSHAHLLRYDSIYGNLKDDIQVVDGDLEVNGKRVKVFQEADPSNLDWAALDVDVVIESTGKFTSRDKVEPHLKAGAKKVLITAPCKDESVQTIVMGINQNDYDPHSFQVFSNASCTTNALGPSMKVLDDAFGVEAAIISTIHSFTYTQNLLDNSNPKDFRRARATTESIIPTSTGAMKAIGLVLPHLDGKLQGMAFRVPTPSVSLLDISFQLKQDTTVEAINAAFNAAESGELKGIVGVCDEPLVSIDFRGNAHSATLDSLSTKLATPRFGQILVWYDNEWAYVSRVMDLIEWITR